VVTKTGAEAGGRHDRHRGAVDFGEGVHLDRRTDAHVVPLGVDGERARPADPPTIG
jgi:hypothetical protein